METQDPTNTVPLTEDKEPPRGPGKRKLLLTALILWTLFSLGWLTYRWGALFPLPREMVDESGTEFLLEMGGQLNLALVGVHLQIWAYPILGAAAAAYLLRSARS